jgi:hypothetical protein
MKPKNAKGPWGLKCISGGSARGSSAVGQQFFVDDPQADEPAVHGRWALFVFEAV